MKNDNFNHIKYVRKVFFAFVFLIISAFTFTIVLAEGETGNDPGGNETENTTIPLVTEFSYTGKVQTYTVPRTAEYQIELWGAQGASYDSTYYGGNGGYTKGTIKLTEGTVLYIYVGNQPKVNYTGGWNGGGYGRSNYGYGRGGGGATDVRTIPASTTDDTVWNNAASLRSRIMVAGAGAGSSKHYNDNSWGAGGGAAGGLTSYKSTVVSNNSRNYDCTVATQTSAGGPNTGSSPSTAGGFGYGGYQHITSWDNAGGGSGWFGGAASSYAGGYSSGGSSYISGMNGSVGVYYNGTFKTNKTGIERSYSYTGYSFYDTMMVDGAGYDWSTGTKAATATGLPSKIDSSTLVMGNTGDGFARITFLQTTLAESLTVTGGTLSENFNPENGNIEIHTNERTLNLTFGPSEAFMVKMIKQL